MRKLGALLIVSRQLLNKLRELLDELRDVRYVTVPVWRPWRDF